MEFTFNRPGKTGANNSYRFRGGGLPNAATPPGNLPDGVFFCPFQKLQTQFDGVFAHGLGHFVEQVADLETIVLARKPVIDALPSAKAPHFIFHSAFCCSTLLARAFDIEGQSIGLKEPTILTWRANERSVN